MADADELQAEGGQPQDAEEQQQPQDAEAAEGEQPQDSGKAEGEAVNRHRYERDIARRDKRIKELEEQLSGSSKGAKTLEERLADLERQLAESKAEAEGERVNARLMAAGCLNAKAAAAILGDYDGDVDALKQDCPYLFKADKPQPHTTGGTPAGSAQVDRVAAARRAAGLPEK